MARLPTELRNEIATIATDPNRMLFGNRIAHEDSTLTSRGAGKGLWLYDELERDDQVATVLQKRRLALVGRRWEVEPAADNDARAAAAAELVSRAFGNRGLERLVHDLLDAVMKGISIVEVIWAATAEGILPAALKHRDPRRFTFVAEADAAGVLQPSLRMLTRSSPLEGIRLPARKMIVHRFGGRYDNPWGLGLGHSLFWPVFFKRQGVAFWLGGLEKFGQPTALGKYPSGTPESEQQKLLEALQAIATDAGVTVPEGMVIELIEAKRSGSFDSYEKLARYMDEAISKVVLGETLTTSNGTGGSRALGDVQNEVRLEITKADADLLSQTLNDSLVRWIVDVNMPGAPLPRLWWDVSEPKDLAAQAERDTKVYALGFRPTLDYVTETYGEGWEPRVEAAQPAPGQDNDLARLFAEAGRAARQRSTLPAEGADRDTADDLTDQLGTMLSTGSDPLMAAIDALVARATTLQDVADGLVALVPEISDDRLAQLMAQALLVAGLSGRSDIADQV
jgi:phage gp29-like protein